MSWLASIALKLFAGPTLSFVSGIVTQLTNEHTAIIQAQTGLAASEANAVVQAEIARQNTVGNVMLAMMTHPIWWVGWALFVLPPGMYAALIHVKSIACFFFGGGVCTDAWNILRVPATIEGWDQQVVLAFFGLFAASPVVAIIASKLGAISK